MSRPKRTILLVEDETSIREPLAEVLRSEGFETLVAGSVAEALEQARRDPDLVLLDVMLPDGSGFEVCRELRRDSQVPIIMLTARGEEADRVVGLELGADDYVVKPFSPREVVLRVEAMLRRGERLSGVRLLNESLDIDDLHIDLPARRVQRGEEVISLTSREFDLLAFLAANPGQTFSKADLLRRVWGWDFGDTSTVTVHVRRLREKVEVDPSDPRLVLTVGRAGYRLARQAELC
jgi:DNA-binding response OmpR family regulator